MCTWYHNLYQLYHLYNCLECGCIVCGFCWLLNRNARNPLVPWSNLYSAAQEPQFDWRVQQQATDEILIIQVLDEGEICRTIIIFCGQKPGTIDCPWDSHLAIRCPTKIQQVSRIMLQLYGGFHKWGYPQSSSTSRWDFPLWTIHFWVPLFWKTPYLHIFSAFLHRCLAKLLLLSTSEAQVNRPPTRSWASVCWRRTTPWSSRLSERKPLRRNGVVFQKYGCPRGWTIYLINRIYGW